LEVAVVQSLPVVKGTLDVLVLKALSTGPMHGFEVVSWLEARSLGTLEVDDSAVYQALYRMEQRATIGAEWGVTENNRRARYYRITAAGRADLKSQTSQWLHYSKLVTGILAS
jgi:PadR family transcriptional regulator PadR